MEQNIEVRGATAVDSAESLKAAIEAVKQNAKTEVETLVNAAKRKGVKRSPSKVRKLAVEVFRSFSRVRVERWISAIVPSDKDKVVIEAQEKKVAEWGALMESASVELKPIVQNALEGAVTLLKVMQETSKGGGSLSAEESLELNKLAIAAIKSGKATQLEIARFVSTFVSQLPTAGIQS